MKLRCRLAVIPVLVAGMCRVAEADALAVRFTKEPSAKKSDTGAKIEFAVSAPTDVAVYIEDTNGKSVCHLVAGVLGKTPPPPLKPDSLEQSLLWDGKNDAGEPAGNGPFRVRVRLGLQPKLDGFLMHNIEASGHICALAVGPQGTLDAFHQDGTANPNTGGIKIKIYTREGRHLRVLAPFPADIAPEKVKALGVFQSSAGELMPRVQNYETLSFYPDTIGVRDRDMPEWTSSPAVDSRGRVYWLVKDAKLCCLDADGGVPYDTFLSAELLPKVAGLKLKSVYYYHQDHPALAISSDDKYVYFAGVSAATGALACVFRTDVATRGPAEVFLGKQDQPGREKDLLSAPRGLAVAKGLLYVADPGADRVAVFQESDRAFLGEIRVKNPQSIGVDPGSGAVYVCAYTDKLTADLIKFDGFANGREICRLTLPSTIMRPNPGIHRIAVDASAKPVLIWMPGLPHGAPLTCIEDAGDKFVSRGDPRHLADAKDLWADGPRDLTVDRARSEVYIKANGQNYYRFDDRTGKLKDILNLGNIPNNVNSTQLVPGWDGNLYTDTWSAGLWRFDHQGKPLNWEGQNTHAIPISGIMCFQERHLALRPCAPVSEFFLVPPHDYLLGKAAPATPLSSLNAFGQDGKTRRTVVWQCLKGAVPHLDRKGNIYLADLVKPPDRSYPAFFDGKLPPPPANCGGGSLFWNSYMYGSIIKFPPTGGVIWFRKQLPPTIMGQPSAELLAQPKVPIKVHWAYTPHDTGELQGALWYRFGFSPYSAHVSGMTTHCMCDSCGFDVDEFGRVFYPNLGQFRVEMVDTDNNWIGAFGRYGNEDDAGKRPEGRSQKSTGSGQTAETEKRAGLTSNLRPPTSDIPLAWPCYVAVSDNYAYVADTVNRRIVRVKLGCAAEAICALP